MQQRWPNGRRCFIRQKPQFFDDLQISGEKIGFRLIVPYGNILKNVI